jgi:hypothetical protein
VRRKSSPGHKGLFVEDKGAFLFWERAKHAMQSEQNKKPHPDADGMRFLYRPLWEYLDHHSPKIEKASHGMQQFLRN